ncbi:hydroxyacylglutathione hydrolase C-terminal domain-containing protein, partial [Klebsiella pneumoniae subsp. pneumoniae]
FQSLQKLVALPGDTAVYCGHEYTESNARFALTIDPANSALKERAAEIARLRAADRMTLPSSIALEMATNPSCAGMMPAFAAASACRMHPTKPCLPKSASARICSDICYCYLRARIVPQFEDRRMTVFSRFKIAGCAVFLGLFPIGLSLVALPVPVIAEAGCASRRHGGLLRP